MLYQFKKKDGFYIEKDESVVRRSFAVGWLTKYSFATIIENVEPLDDCFVLVRNSSTVRTHNSARETRTQDL